MLLKALLHSLIHSATPPYTKNVKTCCPASEKNVHSLGNIFFRYSQVRRFAHSTFTLFPRLPDDSVLDSFLTPVPTLKRSISYIYNQIILLHMESLNSIKMQWENYFGGAVSEDIWVEILKRVHKSSICARHGLIQSKLVHHTYYAYCIWQGFMIKCLQHASDVNTHLQILSMSSGFAHLYANTRKKSSTQFLQ